MDLFLKGILQGSIPTVVIVGGTHHLVKKFRESKPILYWGSLLAATGLTYAVVMNKVPAPFMDAETEIDRYYEHREEILEVKARLLEEEDYEDDQEAENDAIYEVFSKYYPEIYESEGAEDKYECVKCGSHELRFLEYSNPENNGFFCMNCGRSPCGINETDDKTCTCDVMQFGKYTWLGEMPRIPPPFFEKLGERQLEAFKKQEQDKENERIRIVGSKKKLDAIRKSAESFNAETFDAEEVSKEIKKELIMTPRYERFPKWKKEEIDNCKHKIIINGYGMFSEEPNYECEKCNCPFVSEGDSYFDAESQSDIDLESYEKPYNDKDFYDGDYFCDICGSNRNADNDEDLTYEEKKPASYLKRGVVNACSGCLRNTKGSKDIQPLIDKIKGAETFEAQRMMTTCDGCGMTEEGHMDYCSHCDMDFCDLCDHFSDFRVSGVCEDSVNLVIEDSPYVARKGERR